MSMPSVSPSPSSPGMVQHRSRLLRLQDRRFRHRFPQVPVDEKLLNYFSCALVSDILLQGHLFITKNYFAFYSNIFGHKTQILINVADVVKVTKEKIAKFIPNAVGVYTDSEKFIFGSMLSRDSAFRIIQQTWIQSTDAGLGLPEDSDSEVSPALILMADEDSSVSSGVSGHLLTDETLQSDVVSASEVLRPVATIAFAPPPLLPPARLKRSSRSPLLCDFSIIKGYVIKVDQIVKRLSRLSGTSMLFIMSTLLLVILFCSTAMLLYRIHLLHEKLLTKDNYHASSIPSTPELPHLLKADFASVVTNLEERIKSLTQIRSTLEKLLAMANKYQQVPS